MLFKKFTSRARCQTHFLILCWKSKTIMGNCLSPHESTAPAATKLLLPPESKAALAEHGWDKGTVAFGFTASESSVKLAVALHILGMSDVTWVTVSFDDSPLQDIPEGFDPNMMTPGSKQKIGVKSELYKLITGNIGHMPALAINGDMYLESDQILKMLALKNDCSSEVINLIDYSILYQEKIFEALKHWGWSGMHAAQNYSMVNKANYIDYGEGKKDEAWEKEITDVIKDFMSKLEKTLADKSNINGFWVGDSLTLADASLINWVQSLEGVAGLDVKKNYPSCYANWEKVKSSPPEGSLHFIYGFPVFCGFVAQANKDARTNGFDINKYWE